MSLDEPPSLVLSILNDFAPFSKRAELVALLIPAAYVVGGFLAPLLTPLFDWLAAFYTRLAQRLDRTHRSIATRVYRGIVAMVMGVVPALLFASIYHAAIHWARVQPPIFSLALTLLPLAWWGYCLQPLPLVRLWRRAGEGQLPLTYDTYLFTDTHGVMRYVIATQLDRFAIGVVGASLWYVLAGLYGAAIYLTLAALMRLFHTPAFGWATRSLFRVMNILPQLLCRIILLLAALFTQGTRPFHALRARRWPLFAARLMDLSLGGVSPRGDEPWVGDGTPRPDARHLRRLLTLQLAATILLTLAYGWPAATEAFVRHFSNY